MPPGAPTDLPEPHLPISLLSAISLPPGASHFPFKCFCSPSQYLPVPPDPFQCPYFQCQCLPVASDPLPVLPITLRSLIANVPDPLPVSPFLLPVPPEPASSIPSASNNPGSLSAPPVPLPGPRSPSRSSHPSQLPPGSSSPADGVWSPGGHAAAGGCGAAPGPGGCFLNGVGVTRGRIHPWNLPLPSAPQAAPSPLPLPFSAAFSTTDSARPRAVHAELWGHGGKGGGLGAPGGHGSIWGLWGLGGYGGTWGSTEGIWGGGVWG